VYNGSEFALAERLEGVTPAAKQALEDAYRLPDQSILILYLGVSRSVPHIRGGYYDTYDFDDPENFFMFVANPAAHDPSLAPPGMAALSFQTAFPFATRKVVDWPAAKKEATDWFAAKIFQRFPELRDAVVLQESATPMTVQRYTLNTWGSCYGHSYDVGQGVAFAVPRDLMGANILLTGQWTFPGAGVSAVLASGLRTARRILGQAEREQLAEIQALLASTVGTGDEPKVG
jgi:prolycopene isomerase